MNIHCGVQQHKEQKKRQIELFVCCRTHLTLSCSRGKFYCSEVALSTLVSFKYQLGCFSDKEEIEKDTRWLSKVEGSDEKCLSLC